MANSATRAEKLLQLQKTINYTFKNTKLLEEALTHDSNRVNDRTAPTYQRLEFLGDSVLSLVISDYLYRKNPTATEGQLTQERKVLIEATKQRGIAERLNVKDCILFGQSVRPNEFSRCHSFVESLIGAVYMDSGYDEARKMIHHLWEIQEPATGRNDGSANNGNCILS